MNPYEREATAAALRHRVCPKDVLGRSKYDMHVRPRHEAMWIMNLRGYSTPKIAAWAGRDHTSILWGARRHQRRYEAEHGEKWG